MWNEEREYKGGATIERIRSNGNALATPRRKAPPQWMRGAVQKQWFLDRLLGSTATWKLWGNSVGMLDWRLDFQNLPKESGVQWPTSGYALLSGDDWSGYRVERAEILNLIRRQGITGLVSIAGDRHSFQAGVVSESLPPQGFDPVAVEFVTGSVSAPGLFEAAEYNVGKDHPLRAIYLYQPAGSARPQPAINFSIMNGVQASLALPKTGDVNQALARRNRDVAPHLSFMDAGGHGYSVVRAGSDDLEVEFVCIPRPGGANDHVDGGPFAYRVTHRTKRLRRGVAPRVERTGV